MRCNLYLCKVWMLSVSLPSALITTEWKRTLQLPKPHRSQKTPIFIGCLSFNRMVEPGPTELHLLSGGDVNMAGVGVKIEQEESSGEGGLMTDAEPLKTSPSRDWTGNHPLEARQLTPPLSCSPSVRHKRVRKVADRHCRECRKCHWIKCQSTTTFSYPALMLW